uniref:BTB domain-containing protein n=1 Tax=Scleropages formosus TaxID=113540 RepID=A0A8C9S1D3_SCLFO
MAYSSKAPAHVLVLLKNLNFQRATGQFCDCVIRLQLNPEKLYLAHRNILAASSPVLASLLSSQGTLLDLQFPGLTHETLELLLEFIYTGMYLFYHSGNNTNNNNNNNNNNKKKRSDATQSHKAFCSHCLCDHRLKYT